MMDRHEAYSLLAAELEEFRRLGYVTLAGMVGTSSSRLLRGANGAPYEVETSIRWRDRERGDIVVVGTVDAADWYRLERVEQDVIVPSPWAGQ